eukprot:Em0010g477a
MWNGNLIGAYFDAYDHTTLNAPVPVRSPKLSSVGPDQYLTAWEHPVFRKRFSIIENDIWNRNLIGSYFDAYDHTTLNAPVPVRSPMLSSVGPDQYLDG